MHINHTTSGHDNLADTSTNGVVSKVKHIKNETMVNNHNLINSVLGFCKVMHGLVTF